MRTLFAPLPTDSALTVGNYEHTCAEYANRSLNCMTQGIFVPPCDLATDATLP